jgi:RecA-family ATPase
MMFLTEDSRRSLRNRMRSLWKRAACRLDVAEVALGKIHFRIRQQMDLCNWEDVAALVASVYAAKHRPAMLCLDPLRNIHDKDEDKSSEMREVMASLRCIRDLCECAVVFAHHNSKPSANADKRAAAHRMRGSSAIHGAVDGLINLIDTETGPNHITNDVVVVLKDARGAGTFKLELQIQDDEQGEAVKATWKVSDVDEEASPRRQQAKVTPQQQLDAETKVVAYLATSNQRMRQAGQPVVHYSKRALLDAVRSKLDGGGVLRTDNFFALLDDMVDRGKLALMPSAPGQLPPLQRAERRLASSTGGNRSDPWQRDHSPPEGPTT